MRLRQRMPWRKVGHDIYTDDVALELSALPDGVGGAALALRVLLEVRSVRDDVQFVAGVTAPTVGWLLTEAGRAVTPAALARTTGFDLATVETALGHLVTHGVAVRSDSGAWGTLGWASRQEDDSAERKRRQRDRERQGADDGGTDGGQQRDNGRDSHAAGHAGVTPQREEGRGKTGEQEGEQEQPRAEPLALTPATPAPKPTRARRPDPSASPDTRKVWLAYQDLRIQLGLQKPDPRPEAERPGPVPAQVLDITRAVRLAGGVDSFLLVMRRAAEDQHRQAERAGVAVRDSEPRQHFVIVTLGRQVGRYLEQPDLDQRRPTAPARASPRGERSAPPQHPDALPTTEIPE